ncbi:uncharacterized protein LOC142357234 [Convolutriloba macropyga]|uniref:uncharacterized protein LOC142357234 n=1 Tax=Convolutriloba macropyga TaxID=536237 RepID=UPI003F51D9BA
MPASWLCCFKCQGGDQRQGPASSASQVHAKEHTKDQRLKDDFEPPKNSEGPGWDRALSTCSTVYHETEAAPDGGSHFDEFFDAAEEFAHEESASGIELQERPAHQGAAPFSSPSASFTHHGEDHPPLTPDRWRTFRNSHTQGLLKRGSDRASTAPEDYIPKVVHHKSPFLCLPVEVEQEDVIYVKTLQPPAGSSGIQVRDTATLGLPDENWVGVNVWEPADGTHFSVRGQQYMSNKVKTKSLPEVYRVVNMDIYNVDLKTHHIAQKVTVPKPSKAVIENAERLGFPAQLILNFMVPHYPAKLFGEHDGEGFCLIYYLELPETWDPVKHSNPQAFPLMQRFFADHGVECDGTPTRDRLKLIPRLVNLEQLQAQGVFSGTEYRLVNSYRDKPLLTRPQQLFFRGENYLEIDLDVHLYAYVARRALASFFSRLESIVYELGFVVQGNSTEELPEQMLACIRNYRLDFTIERQLPAKSEEPDGIM